MAENTHQIFIGNIPIGGGAPVAVQSMTNTRTEDVEATLNQLLRLSAAGCEIARVAVPNEAAVLALPYLLDKAPMPLIADIHFDYRLAIAAIEKGLSGIRINPGNIGSKDRLNKVIDAARHNKAAIRIGVNSGSVEKGILEKYKHPVPAALVESALNHVRYFERRNFTNIKISLKSSSVLDTISAYREISRLCDYPLHIGVTEAGGGIAGAVKSATGLGILLHEGIGDTMRVSLTGDPVLEVKAAYEILRALGLRSRGPEIISCPGCGRTEIDLIKLATVVEKSLEGIEDNIKVAVMGCVVNGPGEAKEADIGIAGGRNRGIIFRKGKIIKAVNGQEELINAFLEELRKLCPK